jgi:hypothetical protein
MVLNSMEKRNSRTGWLPSWQSMARRYYLLAVALV